MVSISKKIRFAEARAVHCCIVASPRHSFAVDLGLAVVLRCGWLRLASLDKYFGLQLGFLVSNKHSTKSQDLGCEYTCNLHDHGCHGSVTTSN